MNQLLLIVIGVRRRCMLQLRGYRVNVMVVLSPSQYQDNIAFICYTSAWFTRIVIWRKSICAQLTVT